MRAPRLTELTFSFVLLFAIVLVPRARATGGDVGNGGDAVHCDLDSLSPYRGYYSLDFLATAKVDNSDLVQVKSWQDSATRIKRELAAKYPDLYRSFVEFEKWMQNHDDYLKPRIWEEAAFKLVDLDDHVLVRKLPHNCYTKTGGMSAKIIQAVVRSKRKNIVTYEFDPTIYEELKTKAPLQFSFLMVHEWLWDVSSDVAANRRINRFLHSRALEKMDSSQTRLALGNMGLSLRRTGFVSVCERTPEVRRMLEVNLAKDCDQIKEIPLDKNHRIAVENEKMATLRNGDFSGMEKMGTLQLRHNQLEYLPEALFAGLYSLLTLDLSHNKLFELPEGIFEGLSKVDTLVLQYNQLNRLPLKVFQPLVSLQSIHLDHNRITTLTWQHFHGLSRLENVNLSQNELRSLPPGLFAGQRLRRLNLSGNPIPADEQGRIRGEYHGKIENIQF